MSLNSLQDLFAQQLRNLLDIEQQLALALPGIIAGASSPRLKRELESQLFTSHVQVRRLEKIFDYLQLRIEGRVSKGMIGLLEEIEEVLKQMCDPEIRDAALLAVCERIKNYETTYYASAIAFAEQMGNKVCAEYLQLSLLEELTEAKALLKIAATSVNEAAGEVAHS